MNVLVHQMFAAENIFAISHMSDGDLVASRLKEIDKSKHHCLVLRRVVFNPSVCASLWKAIQARQDDSTTTTTTTTSATTTVSSSSSPPSSSSSSSWKKVELRNVDGDITSAISTCMAFNAIEEFQIVLNNREIRDEGWFAISVGLQTNSKLKILQITTTLLPSGIRELSPGITNPTATFLKTLDFSWSTFENHESVQALAIALRQNTTLLALYFAGCSMYDAWVADIVEALQNHPCLEYLNFNSNKAGILTSYALEGLLATNKSLKHLDTSLQTNNKNNNDDESFHIIPPLAEALRHNTTLQVWDLSNCHLTNEDSERLCQALCDNHTLQVLHLPRNKISNDGMATLARLLPEMKGLKRLSLWGNPFEDDGANSLANGLESNHQLEEIDLFRTFPCTQKVIFYTLLNRAGRRLIYDNNTAPIALWPIVLERVQTKLTIPKSSETTALDLSYYLLRHSHILLYTQ